MIDEDLAAVGDAVVFDSSLDAAHLSMIWGNASFIAVSDAGMRLIGLDGTPSGLFDIGLPSAPQAPALAFDGARLLASPYEGNLYAFTSPSFTPAWATPYPGGALVIIDAQPTRATIYTPGRRARLDTSPMAGPIELHHQIRDGIVADTMTTSAIVVGNDEVMTFGAEVWQTSAGDGTALRNLGAV